MKHVLLVLSICLTHSIFAQQMPLEAQRGQVLADRSFEDCQGNIYSVDDLLAEGKPLIIFQSTVDCGYCFEEAPDVSKDIFTYKDRINFVFMLTPHNNHPSCSGEGAGDHDWPGDWQNRYPGYKEIPCSIQPSSTDYFLLLCGVTTSFGAIDPITKKVIDGGCRHDGREAAINAALKMYSDGKLIRMPTTVSTPIMNVSGTGNERNISLSNSTSGADIYYTINGDSPSKNSTKYTGSFKIRNTTLVKAIALKTGSNNSKVTAKMVEFSNASLVNLAPSGTGYEWTGLADIKSNSNRKALAEVNDGKMTDVRLNGGQNDRAMAYEAMGVVWNEVKTGITSIKLTHHTGMAEGWGSRDFFGFDMRIQSTQDGVVWTDLANVGHYPEYPYGGNQKLNNNADPTFFFTDKPLSARGIRVAGQVHIDGTNWAGMTAKQVGLKELEIFKDNLVTANEELIASNLEMIVYPNPSKGELNILLPSNNYKEVSVLDITGRIVLTQIIKANGSGAERLDLSGLQKGMYIISAKGETTLRKKVVID